MADTNCFFSLAILAILIAIFLPLSNGTQRLTASNNSTNPFCRTAENKSLCTSIINGARTWPSATVNAISVTLKLATKGRPMFDDLVKKLPDIGSSRISKDTVGQTCKEIYDFAIECLQGALVDLRYGYKDRLATKLLSVTGPSLECTNAVRYLGMGSQFSNFFSELELYSKTCWSIARAT
ncbi:hypothetical protein L1887_30932 [Cichorium endivia]|nr:hypothetical protein L1887_30932 [Cichorium endivia]